MTYISNGFSFNSVSGIDGEVKITRSAPIAPSEVPADAISIIGHADIANILTGMIGREVPYNRQTVKLDKGDNMFLAQYIGPRLPEGATELPEGSKIELYKLTIS